MSRARAILSDHGELAVPKHLQTELGLKAGDEVVFDIVSAVSVSSNQTKSIFDDLEHLIVSAVEPLTERVLNGAVDDDIVDRFLKAGSADSHVRR